MKSLLKDVNEDLRIIVGGDNKPPPPAKVGGAIIKGLPRDRGSTGASKASLVQFELSESYQIIPSGDSILAGPQRRSDQ